MVVPDSITVSSKFDKATVPQEKESEAVLMVSLEGLNERTDEAKARNGIRCVIALDCSASMADQQKLDLCKKTISFLCSEILGDSDKLGIVTFDSQAKVIFPCSPMTPQNKSLLLSALAKVTPKEHTNLSGGLFQSLDLLRALPQADDFVTAILLLSDGEATSGVTDRSKLVRIATNVVNSFAGAKPTIHAFGYGTSYDEVLSDLAESTSGTFYHVPDVERIPLAFANSMGGLLSIVAQNMTIEVLVSGGGAQIFPSNLTQCSMDLVTGSLARLNVRDIYLGEKKDILVKMKMPALPNGFSPVECRITVTYMDVIKEAFVTINSLAKIDRVQNSSIPEEESEDEDIDVVKQKIRVETANTLDEARKAAENGFIGQSRTLVDHSLGRATKFLRRMKISEDADHTLKDVLADLRNASDSLNTVQTPAQFKATGISRTMQEASWSHANQRSNTISSDRYATVSQVDLRSMTKNKFNLS